jgi:hypothetical protein
MAKKAFEIQNSTLRVGGLELQAGTTQIVIPGVTQAVNYFVEEVDEADGVNPDTFGSDANAISVIDNAEYLYRSGTETPSNLFSAAAYNVEELDDGEIEEISVVEGLEGTFLSADKAFAEAGNMWATTVSNALDNFSAGDWTQIPFRPKMRAGEIENIGGGSGNTGDVAFDGTEIFPDNDGDGLLLASYGTDSNETLRADLTLNGNNGTAIMRAKEHFEREWSTDSDLTITWTGTTLTLAPAANRYTYLRGMLERMTTKFDGGEGTTFNHNYQDIKVTIAATTGSPVTATVTDVDNNYSTPPTFTVTLDQTAPSSVTITAVTFKYDYFNTMGFNTDDGSFGVATDNEDFIINSGRDIELRAKDDIHISGRSQFNLDLSRYDGQSISSGIDINLKSDTASDKQWRFRFDGSLSFPDGTKQRTAYLGDQLTVAAYKGFKAIYGRMYDDEPTISKVLIYQDTVTPTSEVDTSTDDDLFKVSGLTGSGVVALVNVYGTDTVNPEDLHTLRVFVENVIDSVILSNGEIGNINTAANMRSAFYNNFGQFANQVPDRYENFKFFKDYWPGVSSGTVLEGSGAEFTISKTTNNTFTPSSYGDTTALRVYSNGSNLNSIEAVRANWAVPADYDTLEALPNGTVFLVELAGGTYTFTVESLMSGPGTDVTFYGAFSPEITELVDEAPTSISFNTSYSVSVTATGSNYLVGDKIKVLGSALGGIDVVNDAIITVTALDSGDIDTLSISGFASSTATSYTGVTGTNYNKGSGASFNLSRNTVTQAVTVNVNNNGTNYIVGDVITILGTALDGASPANDIVITVTGVDGGEIQSTSHIGTLPATVFPIDNIDDGGSDQYDVGNFIYTNIQGDSYIDGPTEGETALDYNGGVVADGEAWFGVGSEYVVTYQDSIFGLFVTGADIDWIATNGNSGFDGDGQADTGSLFRPINPADSIGTGNQFLTVNSDGSITFPDGSVQTTAADAAFVQLADGSLQAQTSSEVVASLSSTLTAGKPAWLSITPRSPDRNTLDTHYGFDSNGMWFTGDNEATYQNQPAYPIHTTASFPADTKVVVEFDVSVVAGEEDWGVCVYPANGIPHWTWGPHPSRIAAAVDCSVDGDPYVQANIYGLTDDVIGTDLSTPAVDRARFTYDPVAEMSTFELLDADGVVTARSELPGRLDRGQDYRIGFDADWDEAGPTDKSYFTNLNITVGETGVTKTTELTITGEVKLPNTVKGFVNIAGPWINNNDDIVFQSVATHDGFAYIGGEGNWGNGNNGRLDKYSLTTGELVWTRVLGAGRNALFNISWTGGTYTLDAINTGGTGYQTNEILYIAGDSFTGGDYTLNRATITVTAVDDTGSISTATIAGTAPSGTNSATGVSVSNGDASGFPQSVKYDTVNDNLVVLHYQNSILNSQAAVIRINPANGDVVDDITLTDEGDIYAYDVAIHPTVGWTAVVGEKFNEFRNFGTLTMLATGNGYFDILKSELDEEHWPGNQIPSEPIGNFLISGTGIATTENVDNVNYYPAVASTTRQGSGAVFLITDNGNGTYTAQCTNGGSNYRAGHKIKILGTSIGGATPDNDIIITVNAIAEGGVIVNVSNSGTAAGTGIQVYSDLSGTNVDVGSGMTLNVTVDTLTGSILTSINSAGSNYVDGDVAIITGTTYANGATPTHDTTVAVVSVGGSGDVTSVVTSNTPPTDAVRIVVNGVDFTTVGGSWSMKQNLDSEAFVWTPLWNKAIGGGVYDRFESVVYSKDGDSIYAVGSGYYETSYSQSLVVKFAAGDGTIGFSKYLNSGTTDAFATGVATIGASDIVVSGYEYNAVDLRNKQFVARLNSGGTVLWKKFYDTNWSQDLNYNSDIQVDSDNNIYVTTDLADNNPSWSNSGFTATKLDPNGNILWSRCISGSNSSYTGNAAGNRWSSLHNDQLVMAGYTYETDNDYYNGLWASLPTDGFTYLGGEGDFVQMGAFRLSEGRIKNVTTTPDTGGSFTASEQPPNITAVTNLKKYATRDPIDSFPQHLHKMVDPKHGGLVFGDGTKQTTAADQIPQIRADNDYYITVNDSGKHIYFRNNGGTVYIPGWWSVDLPVGFTFTIVNRAGEDCYVSLEGWPGAIGTILGAGRNLNYQSWGIPDSGSGSMVTLIKLEDGHTYNNNGQQDGQVWMISGPSDIYIND